MSIIYVLGRGIFVLNDLVSQNAQYGETNSASKQQIGRFVLDQSGRDMSRAIASFNENKNKTTPS